MADGQPKRDAVFDKQERLTRVSKGTPGGEYLRRFWHPIAASAELKGDEVLPVIPVKILGERLALFRCEDGTLGLVAERCPHRGAALSYGMVEDGCIRCPYHGWKFDKAGQCVDTPAESKESTLKERIKIDGYEVVERKGLIWAYLGPKPAPLLPNWQFVVREDYKHDVGITRMPCNWFQIAENNMDPLHVEHLHMRYTNYVRSRLGEPTFKGRKHDRIAFEPFPYGIIKKRLWEGDSEDSVEWTVGHPVIYPATAQILYHNGWVQYQIRTPVDDTNTIIFWYNCLPREAGEKPQTDVPMWENPCWNKEGQFMPEQINAQDMMVFINQGDITDHTLENLGESDKGVVLFRRTILKEIERVERGEDPTGTVRDVEENTPWIDLPIEDETTIDMPGVRASAVYDAPVRNDLQGDKKREPAE